MTDDNQTSEPKVRTGSSWGKAGLIFSLIGVLVLAAGFIYSYFAIMQINAALNKTVTKVENHSTAQLAGLQQSVIDLQSSVQKAETALAQQEQTIADWRLAQKGDFDKWYAAEAQYLVKLANDQLQFSSNIDMAIVLLGRAQETLQTAQDANLLNIRKAIAQDIARLQALPKADITQLYINLTTLNNQADQLILPASPLSQVETQPETIPSSESWWRAGLERSWAALRKIVIVRYNGSNSLPLILPQEKTFLYQNLHAQFENALWAALNRNEVVYQAALARINDWIKKYFVQNGTAQTMLQQLQALQAINIKPTDVNLAETLALFDKAQFQPAPATT